MSLLKKVVASAVLGVSTSGSAFAATETHTFNTSESAAAAGWTEVNSRQLSDPVTPTNFGFSNTANASEPDAPGEAGGTFYRDPIGTPSGAYYADISIGQFDINTPVEFTTSWAQLNVTRTNATKLSGVIRKAISGAEL